ncbi:MAG: phosphodiesterase [Spirochaetia bacterium]|nr:phosphodiesterase [Spirochaetia bacterium]
MKYIIASDIHGSAFWCRKLLEAYSLEHADRMLLLGDILYHGPRNDLPQEYSPKSVIAMLNQMKQHILCVRGNCDTEVDQMVMEFPIMAEYAVLSLDNRMIFATHGHRFNSSDLPPLCPGDILLHGHTHIPLNETVSGIAVMNPGSVSIPKGGSAHSYMTLENGIFQWKELN